MDEQLIELIEAAFERLERLRADRRRIVAAVLAEASDDLRDDLFHNAVFDNVTRELERRAIFSRVQANQLMRNLSDLLPPPESTEDALPVRSMTDGAETTVGQPGERNFSDPDTTSERYTFSMRYPVSRG